MTFLAVEDDNEDGWGSLPSFSEAVALLYEAQIDGTRAPLARRALQELLGADEIAIQSGPLSPSERPSRSPTPGVTGEARSGGHVLWADIGVHEQSPRRMQFRRNAAREPFSDEDVRMLALLRRHLRSAHVLEVITGRSVFECLASAQLTRTMVIGLLVTDLDGHIHWRNPTAAEILANRDGLIDNNGRLCARRAFETARLETLTRNTAGGRHGVMLVARPAEMHPYGLSLAPMNADAEVFPVELRNKAFVLITIKEMRRQIQLITQRLGELFGFTPAEEHLGALLLDGYTLNDAARLGGKSLSTVKTQLRSMLKKTGTHSQTELIHIFLSLPSIF